MVDASRTVSQGSGVHHPCWRHHITEASPPRPAPRNVVAVLLPFTLAIFLGFLAVGIPLPVLPSYVHDQLGFGSIVTGSLVGVQSLATLLTRQFAGRLCDTRRPKRIALSGLLAAAAAGLCYLAASAATAHPSLSLGLLLAGRLVLGFGESLFITALLAWSIAHVGPMHAGRAMAWSGIAMYGALAIGAPLGIALDNLGGFTLVSACAVLCPLLGGALAVWWTDTAPTRSQQRQSFLSVVHAIWMPGLAMALASSGVGTITAFLALRYRASGWSNPGLALSGFGAAYIAVRLLFGGLPDRLGGYRTALVSLVVEAMGLLALWQATSPLYARAGATLTGVGYSLVFPSLGVEAMKRVSGDSRGLVLGAYLACFDLGLAAAGPLAGVIIDVFDLPTGFAAAAVAALAGFVLTLASRAAASRQS